MKSYQVNFLVKAIVSVNVKAETFEDAMKLAKEKMNRRIFVNGVDVQDESNDVCGYDDDDMWAEVE